MDEPMLISLIPADMARQKMFADIPVPQPSIEHTLIKCDGCGKDAWIGPGQLTHLTFHGGTKKCYWCLMPLLASEATDVQLYPVNPGNDDAPRRT